MAMFDVATAYGLRKRSVALRRPVTKWPLLHAMITIELGPDPQLTLRHACDYRSGPCDVRPWRPSDGRDAALRPSARTADRVALLPCRADGGVSRRCRPARNRGRP